MHVGHGWNHRRVLHGCSALLSALVLASLTAACSSAAGQGGPTAGTHWILRSYLGSGATVQVPDGVVADLVFAGGQASGSDGCNHFSGAYTADGSSLEFGQLATTAMGCLGPGTSVEPGYMAALANTASYTATAAALTLFDKNGIRLAEFLMASADPSAAVGFVMLGPA